jgi:hypothetical protein
VQDFFGSASIRRAPNYEAKLYRFVETLPSPENSNEIALSDYHFCRSEVETLPKQGVRDSILSITAFLESFLFVWG